MHFVTASSQSHTIFECNGVFLRSALSLVNVERFKVPFYQGIGIVLWEKFPKSICAATKCNQKEKKN